MSLPMTSVQTPRVHRDAERIVRLSESYYLIEFQMVEIVE